MARVSNPRFSLNIYKLREGTTRPEGLVDVAGFPYSAKVDIGEELVARLYYGASQGKPDWLQTLSSKTISPLEDLRTSSVSGVMLACVNQSHFALTFGHAWQRVRHVGIEPNFGIRCVLNIAAIDSLRAIRRDRVAEDFVQAIEQIPDSDDISRFGMDVDKDLLRGVKAKVDEGLGFGAWISGADSFKASIDLDHESIAAYLLRCLGLWRKDSYLKDFKWVDNISPVRDETLEERLAIVLAEQVATKNPALTLCVPDLLMWDDYDIFSFERKKSKQSPCANHLELEQWVGFITGKGGEVTRQILAENHIYAYKIDGVLKGKWPVSQCINGLVSLDGKCFLSHGGNWFEINNNFVDEVNEKIEKIPSATISLPLVNLSENERDYNARVSSCSGGAILQMDRKLISHGGGRSRFEVCDLFTEDGHLICVKPWGGKSGDLSHLFQQARNSIQLINKDDVYREKVRWYMETYGPNFKLSWDYICDEPRGAEVVLAVLRGCAKESLPFFAKLSLANCVGDLQTMRFKASYLVVDVLSTDTRKQGHPQFTATNPHER